MRKVAAMAHDNEIRIALAQMEVIPGQPSRNFETISAYIERARGVHADLVVFPEMCVGGYFLADRWNDNSFVDYLVSFNERIRALSRDIGVVFGNVCRKYLEPVHRGKDGRTVRYNAALFAQNGTWVARHASDNAPAGRYLKSLQPDYRMFDDERYFVSSVDDAGFYKGKSWERDWLAPFEFEHAGHIVRVGLQVCEDLWSGDYAQDITRYYAENGCELIVNISASPWTLNKDAGRDKRVLEHARDLSGIPPLAYVNCVGMQNTGKNILSFDGGSALYGNEGQRTASARDDFEEDFVLVSLDLRNGATKTDIESAREKPYVNEDEKTLDSLVSTIRRFDAQTFPWRPKWIIGLSGGIDSSVTAALMHLAFGGSERIVGYNLATKYNSDATKMNAYKLAASLGLRLVNGSIEDVVRATASVMALYGYPEAEIDGLTQENVQARLRGHMLSTFAAVESGVIMNNGNKVESALGYATLYGDAIGAISPLGDITKARLFRIAKIINQRLEREVVPENLIPNLTEDGYLWETMPSAELRDNQKDPMKWFYHDWLIERLTNYPGYGIEAILREYLDGRLQASEVGKWIRFYGLDDPKAFIEDLEWVCGQMVKSVFKRIQMPPVVTVTRGSFGFDIRENQISVEKTPEYLKLRERILSRAR